MNMNSLKNLARRELVDLKQCIHGGEIWEISQKYKVNVEEIIDFSANINPLGPSPKSLEAIKSNLENIKFYPDSNSKDLRIAIAKHFKTIKPSNIIVGNGSTELIYTFTCVFINKGDEAIIPIPTFGEYEVAVKEAGGRPVYVELNQEFNISPSNLLSRVNHKTKVIFLCNPNNPTGNLMSKRDVLEIVEMASRRDVLVFIDEAFMDFIPNEEKFSLISEVRKYWNLFILRSFTKFFGLAGLRIGYGIACEEMIDLLLKAKIPWNVNYLAQVAAKAALSDINYIEETRKLIARERDFLCRKLKQIPGLKVYPSHANFILVDLRNTGLTSLQLKRKLLKYGILIRDCSSFRGLDEYYVRIAIRTREENEKLIRIIRKVLEGALCSRN